ncbi:DUF1381 domain-containing protein [Staphylococcus aureus]|uniref:DUF1381 domain-containing protein n=1 Tax=Staphylococcus aureus TaxID=1280 RepID=UPI000B9545A5|nr:DUF1381 domain-containing protein [Staphylococcus aureus]
MQFLVRKTHHTTGEVFLDVTRAKENEKFTVIEAESKEEAKEKYEAQVKRDAVIKVGQLYENIRECGK